MKEELINGLDYQRKVMIDANEDINKMNYLLLKLLNFHKTFK